LLKSYTSLVGSKFDRTKEDLDNFSIKNVFLDSFLEQSSKSEPISRCLSGVSRSMDKKSLVEELFSIEESTWRGETDEFGDAPVCESTDDENEEISLLNDPNERYKSIRRSQVKSGSAKDVLFQMKSLKAKTKFNHEQNQKIYNYSDRNVRYGDPLPRRPLYRELRILSKFELTT